jgi:hypothetical protein
MHHKADWAQTLQWQGMNAYSVGKGGNGYILSGLTRCTKVYLHTINIGLGIALGHHQGDEPVPQPMSNTRCPPRAQAPTKTPSVPTFIAQRSCCISNCLNVNLLFIVFLTKNGFLYFILYPKPSFLYTFL